MEEAQPTDPSSGPTVDNESLGGKSPNPICDGNVSVALLMDTSFSMLVSNGSSFPDLGSVLGGASNSSGEKALTLKKQEKLHLKLSTLLRVVMKLEWLVFQSKQIKC